MCDRCNEVKERHRDFNYCPYCGKELNKYGFTTPYIYVRDNIPFEERHKRYKSKIKK